ncbi:MAG TPA: tripartite tricarboxylate transporter TctB family protein [Burkholderiaceae bacterium]|nr:tripartite tricarboxylate transporter TctB family protein [Burkholderiaceae bacterium]
MEQEQAAGDKPVVSVGTMEIVVAIGFILVAALVMFDSVRLGHRWGDSGPDAGYFPFYISLLMMFAGFGVLLGVVFARRERAKNQAAFVHWRQFRPVLAVFAPLAMYVLAMQYIGLYVAAALFVGAFMRINGGYGLRHIVPIAIAVPVVAFLLFEYWFLVPLPKGPLETWLGF